ncbi:MAG: alanyl-tRNA editing protein [Oscillibacter sp.]|nr:alanyl-tRNA editing protein [Oscillibacter sp.]
METEKLYYQDAYLREFTAEVISCEPAKDAWKVVLNRTAFYPEGGGQPADHGTLGGVQVLDVHEKEGIVYHTCSAPLEAGQAVQGAIDWGRRFDHMQQHSGEHILSGIICRRFQCDNVGFHLGAEAVTIDFNAEITWEQVLEVEQEANAFICADKPVEITYPTPEGLAALDYRSKKELTGQVRIVAFPGADCCACCGTHVRQSGAINVIKILSCQKFREGVRMEIVCGGRATAYLSAVYGQAKAIGQRLSVKPLETLAAVERLEKELAAAKIRMTELEQTAFRAIAAENTGKGNVILFQPAMKSDSVRRLADVTAQSCGGFAAVFSGEGEHWAYALVQSGGSDITAQVKAMNQALNGRGGGRNGFAQGSVNVSQKKIEDFFKNPPKG